MTEIQNQTVQFFCGFFCFVFFALTMLLSLWDLSSPTRDRTLALGSESTES